MTDQVEVQVESIAFGGDAVARHNGLAMFIPGGAPGDFLRVQITERNRRYVRASIVDVLQPGSARVVAPCPVYPRCGGCQWQHITYAEQFKAKVDVVTRALARFEPRQVQHWPAPATSGYRRRARLHWTSRDGVTIGFRERQSERLVDITRCLQLEPALEACLPRLRELLEHADRTSGHAELLSNHRNEIHLGLRVDSGNGEKLIKAMQEIDNAWWHGARVTEGSASIVIGAASLELDARGLMASATAFTQANAAQDAVLRDCVSRLVSRATAERVLEFHAGIGNFTLDIARSGVGVDAVEANPEAVSLLQNNCHGLLVNAITADADQHEWLQKPDCVLLDPPREGAAALMTRLASKRVPHIIYVSCDPMTLARDLTVLMKARYRLHEVNIIDMMPHTYHIETVCFLSRH